MARLITIYWRDMPSRIVGRRGRTSVRENLPARFQTALQRAALRAGKGSTDKYLDDWRRESREIDAQLPGDTSLETVVRAELDKLISAYDDERLDQLAKNHGREN